MGIKKISIAGIYLIQYQILQTNIKKNYMVESKEN